MKTNRLTYMAALALTAVALLSGCVSKKVYERDTRRLIEALRNERAAHAEAVKKKDYRISEQASALKKITERYAGLQERSRRSESAFHALRGDLEALLHDTEELRLVVRTNMDGSVGREMEIKLEKMRRNITRLLNRRR